ncbi:3-isopropylmalate dehydratase small subunit [Halomarina rubra]|uniref:3-isopropylmalate dehydratase small subunit 2 n=1 Tax=Halomarina rubra TaxID=2071873 RepID=A0ABD6AWV0_9EURY|nr:3-isopropylmalate dehydratase small subunit [Halomarina rubra]
MTDGATVPTVTHVSGRGVPIRGDDIDTDQILPARFLKETTFEAMGEYAFHDQRRDDDGAIHGDHPLDRHPDGEVLVVNDNFGCGSSREHAPQALQRWGVDGIVGESFAEIFHDNCTSLGIPVATAPHDTIARLQEYVEANPETVVELDVENERVSYDDTVVEVTISDSMREALVEGRWDTTELLRSNMESVERVHESLSPTQR